MSHVVNGTYTIQRFKSTVKDRQMLFLQMRRSFDGLVFVDIFDDVVDLTVAILQMPQRLRNRLVDNLQQPAADKLFVLDQGNVRFHARGVTVHHESDASCRRQDRDLRVLVTKTLPLNERVVPGSLCSIIEV